MTEPIVRHAIETDSVSLSTIVPRAFHKTNDYLRKTFPDTPLIREWWKYVFLDAIRDPTYQVLVISDADPATSEPRHIVGLSLLSEIEPGSFNKSVFVRISPTSDHDLARYTALLEAAFTSEDEPSPRKEHMSGRRHFVVDLFGVDDKYQGAGLGKKLLNKTCDISDEEGIDVFVMANLKAKPFYEKCGFVSVHEIILPGDDGYGEAYLIYKAGSRASSTCTRTI